MGTSAYLGAAPLIQNKDYLAAAGSILTTEAIHTSLQRFFTKGFVAPVTPYGTGLGANEVFTLASGFITACPSTNSPLPFKAFPSLAAVPALGTINKLGHPISFTTTATLPTEFYATFIAGLNITSVAATNNAGTVTATIPDTTYGQTYVVLTSANVTGALMDSQVIAGPAVFEVGAPYPTRNDGIM